MKNLREPFGKPNTESRKRVDNVSVIPELLDQALIHSDGEASLDEDNPPCASGKVRKGRHSNDNRTFLVTAWYIES
jgi:hypothetical protein